MKISKMEEAITYNYCTQITYASIWVSLSVFSHESNHTVLALRYRFARLEVSVYSMQAFFDADIPVLNLSTATLVFGGCAFPPVRPGRRLPVQGLSEGSLGYRDRLPA